MMSHRPTSLTRRGVLRWSIVALSLAIAAACSHLGPPIDETDPRFDPIAIHVRNENFLDMRILVVVGGSSRRIGQVSGNGTADFSLSWTTGNGSGIVLQAVPIGGGSSVTMPALNVGPGQLIDFRIASLIRQSSVSVREP